MSYNLHDYVSVIQFLTAASFALSFEKVLDLSSLGKAVAMYYGELYLFNKQYPESNHYNNISIRSKAPENLQKSGDGNKFLVPSCLGRYSWWFLICSLCAFAVLVVADGRIETLCRPGFFWCGMTLAALGVLSWGAITFFNWSSYSLATSYIRETNRKIRLSYGNIVESPANKDKYGKELLSALPSNVKDKLLQEEMNAEGLREKVRSYQLKKLDDFLGKRWFLSRLLSRLREYMSRDKKYIIL